MSVQTIFENIFETKGALKVGAENEMLKDKCGKVIAEAERDPSGPCKTADSIISNTVIYAARVATGVFRLFLARGA